MDLVGDAGRQVLVGKVDGGLEMGQRPQAQRAPVLVEPVQRAIHLLQRLAALLVGLGGDQVGDGLGLGEVELAVLEGAARELAGLGHAAEAELGDRVERAADDGAAAMQCSSAMVSPVSLAGASNHTARPRSIVSPLVDRTGCAPPCGAARAAPGRAPNGRARRRAAR